MRIGLAGLLVLWSVAAVVGRAVAPQAPAPVRILLDQPLRAVEYQLDRLTNDELVRVERRDDDARYRPVYEALLTRRSLATAYRDEALAALVTMDPTSPASVLLRGLARVPVDDAQTAATLLRLLFAQPVEALRGHRDAFTEATGAGSQPLVLRAAYGGIATGDGRVDSAWDAAAARPGHLAELLRAVPHLPAESRAQFFAPIAALLGGAPDDVTRAPALDALGWTDGDTAAFDLLAREVVSGGAGEPRVAAVRSLLRVPERVWPEDGAEPLTLAILAFVRATPVDRRTEPAAVEAVELGQRLTAALPGERGRALRRDLLAAGVQVVRIATVPDQMRFDLKWFVVEADRPVQILLSNPDAMPHNLLIGRPASLEEIGPVGGAMPMPADPGVKPFVPESPLVLQATGLLGAGETARLDFTAPTEPGEYVFLCTFPGHWVRMYGVMLVVESREAWEARPTVPTDPMTRQPFTAP